MRTLKEQIILCYLYGLYMTQYVDILNDYFIIKNHADGYEKLIDKYEKDLRKSLK